MLDAWIIDQIRRQEQELERLREEQRPRLEIPLYEDRAEKEDREDDKDSGDVVIVIQMV
jgi:hypothetical protein